MSDFIKTEQPITIDIDTVLENGKLNTIYIVRQKTYGIKSLLKTAFYCSMEYMLFRI